jgi:hypothetical protein
MFLALTRRERRRRRRRRFLEGRFTFCRRR